MVIFPFLGKGRMQPSVHLSMGSLLYTLLQDCNNMSWNSFIFQTSDGISSRPVALLFLIFLMAISISFVVKGPIFMSNL